MKKLITMTVVLMMVVAAFADGNSCSVTNNLGANGSVILLHNNAQSGGNGQVCTKIKFTGDKGNNASTNTINVMVYCYDASGQFIDAKSATVKMNGTVTFVCFDVKADKAYTFKISDAHCN